MDTDIALARLAAGRTVPIGAECGCGVHDGPPGVVWKHAKRSIFGPPFSLQVSCTTVKCRATLLRPAGYFRYLSVCGRQLCGRSVLPGLYGATHQRMGSQSHAAQ